MSSPDDVGEGTVSGNQVSIPANIRRQFDIDDGDVIRWKVVDDELIAEVRNRTERSFQDFEPGTSEDGIDGVEAHDRFGLE